MTPGESGGGCFVAVTYFVSHSHFTITHKPWVWKVVMTISESVNGTSSYCWWYQVSLSG